MNKLILGMLIAGVALTGCVSKSEIIIGRDSEGNEITREIGNIDKTKACEARTKLAVSFIDMKNMAKAKENLDIAQSYSPDNLFLLLAWGYYYQTVEDDHNTNRIYEKVFSEYPESGDGYAYYGVYKCHKKQYAEAEKLFMTAISKPNYNQLGFAYEKAAICAYENNETAKAKRYFDEAMKYAGSNPSLLYAYALYSYENQDYVGADKLMRTYDMFQKYNTPATYFLKIKIATALGQYSTAEIFGRKLLNTYGDSVEAKKYRNGEY